MSYRYPSAAQRHHFRTYTWLRSLTATPDARGDLIETLRNRTDLPSHFPNRLFLYRFVRDKFRKSTREHLDATAPLYDEYRDWCRRQHEPPDTEQEQEQESA